MQRYSYSYEIMLSLAMPAVVVDRVTNDRRIAECATSIGRQERARRRLTADGRRVSQAPVLLHVTDLGVRTSGGGTYHGAKMRADATVLQAPIGADDRQQVRAKRLLDE